MSTNLTKELTGQELADYIDQRFPKKLNEVVEIEEDEPANVQDLAIEASKYFTIGERDNGETFFYKTTSNCPQWVTELVRNAHGDFLPDDYRYKWIAYALDAFSDYEDGHNAIDEVQPDVYNFDLLKWVSSNLYRMAYVDEAIQNGAQDLASALTWAQSDEIRETYYGVLESLEAELTSREHD